MYGLTMVSPDITIYVSAICVTQMETRISIVYGSVSYPCKHTILSMVLYR